MARTLSCAERRASTFCLRSASGASIQGMPGRASWAFWTTLCHLSTLSENELLLMTTSSEKEDRRNGDPRHSNLCESVTSARFHPPRPARVRVQELVTGVQLLIRGVPTLATGVQLVIR